MSIAYNDILENAGVDHIDSLSHLFSYNYRAV